MRVMTYNILCGGQDAGVPARLERICSLIRGVAPDVLVLNECNGFELDGFRNLHLVERELGMRGVLATASSGFHVALFVRGAQLLQTHLLQREVHHSAIGARLQLGELQFTVIGAHLCPFSGEVRAAEAQQLTRFSSDGLALLLGDLNALSPHDAAQLQTQRWLPRRRVRHELAGGNGQLDTRAVALLERAGLVDLFHAAGASSPTALTRLCADWQSYQLRIDYAFATPGAAERVQRVQRVDGALADEASDHYPLLVELA